MFTLKIEKFIAAAMAGCMLLCPVRVNAASVVVVKVGEQVAIPGDDIQAGGSLTKNEAEKTYAEFREGHSSASTEVETNKDKVVRSHLPEIPEDETHSVSNPTLTYEEFLELIEDMTESQQQKYKERVKELQKGQENKEEENEKRFIKYLKEIFEAAKNDGMDGNGNSGDDSVYKKLRAFAKKFGVNGTNIDEIIDGLLRKQIEGMRRNNDMADNGSRKIAEEQVSDREESIRKNGLNASNGIDYTEIGESAYNKDTFNPDGGIENLYICAKCGKTYGSLTHCECGKTLEYVNDPAKNLAPIGGVDDNGYLMVDMESEAGVSYAMSHGGTTDITVNESLGNDTCGVPYAYCYMTGTGVGKGYIICEYCGRVANIRNIESWVVQYSKSGAGCWACYDCYHNTGEPKALDTIARDPVTGEWMTNQTFAYTYSYTGHMNMDLSETGNGGPVVHVVGIQGIYEDTLDALDPEQTMKEISMAEKYEKMKEILHQAEDPFNGNWPENAAKWTDKDIDAYIKYLHDTVEGGIPPEEDGHDGNESGGNDGEKVRESDEFDEQAKKVFGGWPADKDTWTEKQKDYYDEYVKYKKLVEKMEGDGVFDNDDPSETYRRITDYEAAHTSVTDTVITTMVAEYDESSAVTHTEERSVIGLGKFEVYDDSTGEMVAWNDMWDKVTKCIWLVPKEGSYTLKREVTVYDVQWRYTQYTGHVTWTIDGCEDLPPLYDKEINRIREDDTGTNARNARTVRAADIHIRAVPGGLDINAGDFTTERIR